MKTITLDEATRRLNKTLRDVCRDHEPVTITRDAAQHRRPKRGGN